MWTIAQRVVEASESALALTDTFSGVVANAALELFGANFCYGGTNGGLWMFHTYRMPRDLGGTLFYTELDTLTFTTRAGNYRNP